LYETKLIPLLPTLPILPLLFTGCSQTGKRPLDVDKETEYCAQAEQNLECMQCRDRAGDPMWEGFRETCERLQKGKGDIFLNPKCIADANRCSEVNQCPAEGME